MKKRRLLFKSLYTKLLAIFLGAWWGLNLMIIAVMVHVITLDRLRTLYPVVKEVGGTFYNFILYTSIAFAASLCIGTVLIIFVVRGIVKPIRTIADATGKIASGDFDVIVDVKRTDELGQLAQNFNIMTQELKSIDAQRNSFVSSVSHEFRTPITSIKGYAELLRDDVVHINELTDEKRLQYCNIITGESVRLIALSSDLLRLSELDSRIIRERATTFSLDEQLRKTILLLEPLWTKKEIEFDIELAEVDYFGDKDLLGQVWINLIQNAIKFSMDGGSIAIRLRKKAIKIVVEIEDYGIGISQADKEQIFESFYKVSRSRSNEGNGLGLAIVKRIIDVVQGSIRVESELGRGTKFIVELHY
ncbi:HAMP domain-containing sensor histidine kinase [Anaerosporobacter sp.]|uniref:HAMP domain-containing sensor histidine kinase n=1 Tax=Anaerosporobacter sp. TaxID=1872529 RepID=UPI00286EFCF4|nr:HAMP domain-containing sensor histidine kinase [Anaerosporobacter sp.]